MSTLTIALGSTSFSSSTSLRDAASESAQAAQQTAEAQNTGSADRLVPGLSLVQRQQPMGSPPLGSPERALLQPSRDRTSFARSRTTEPAPRAPQTTSASQPLAAQSAAEVQVNNATEATNTSGGPIRRQIRGWSGVAAPWQTVFERFSFLMINPSIQTCDGDEVRDDQRRPVRGASILTNLLGALLSILFIPLMPFVGMVRLFQGHFVDGPLTMVFGPLINLFGALKNLFFDIPHHSIQWARGN